MKNSFLSNIFVFMAIWQLSPSLFTTETIEHGERCSQLKSYGFEHKLIHLFHLDVKSVGENVPLQTNDIIYDTLFNRLLGGEDTEETFKKIYPNEANRTVIEEKLAETCPFMTSDEEYEKYAKIWCQLVNSFISNLKPEQNLKKDIKTFFHFSLTWLMGFSYQENEKFWQRRLADWPGALKNNITLSDIKKVLTTIAPSQQQNDNHVPKPDKKPVTAPHQPQAKVAHEPQKNSPEVNAKNEENENKRLKLIDYITEEVKASDDFKKALGEVLLLEDLEKHNFQYGNFWRDSLKNLCVDKPNFPETFSIVLAWKSFLANKPLSKPQEPDNIESTSSDVQQEPCVKDTPAKVLQKQPTGETTNMKEIPASISQELGTEVDIQVVELIENPSEPQQNTPVVQQYDDEAQLFGEDNQQLETNFQNPDEESLKKEDNKAKKPTPSNDVSVVDEGGTPTGEDFDKEKCIKHFADMGFPYDTNMKKSYIGAKFQNVDISIESFLAVMIDGLNIPWEKIFPDKDEQAALEDRLNESCPFDWSEDIFKDCKDKNTQLLRYLSHKTKNHLELKSSVELFFHSAALVISNYYYPKNFNFWQSRYNAWPESFQKNFSIDDVKIALEHVGFEFKENPQDDEGLSTVSESEEEESDNQSPSIIVPCSQETVKSPQAHEVPVNLQESFEPEQRESDNESTPITAPIPRKTVKKRQKVLRTKPQPHTVQPHKIRSGTPLQNLKEFYSQWHILSEISNILENTESINKLCHHRLKMELASLQNLCQWQRDYEGSLLFQCAKNLGPCSIKHLDFADYIKIYEYQGGIYEEFEKLSDFAKIGLTNKKPLKSLLSFFEPAHFNFLSETMAIINEGDLQLQTKRFQHYQDSLNKHGFHQISSLEDLLEYERDIKIALNFYRKHAQTMAVARDNIEKIKQTLSANLSSILGNFCFEGDGDIPPKLTDVANKKCFSEACEDFCQVLQSLQ